MNHSKKRSLWLLLLAAMIVLAGPQRDSRVSALDKDAYKSLKVFTEVLDIVEKNYVEEVEKKTLVQGAINGMMKSLDPHSAFMTPDMLKELEVETRGSFGGIGIEITIQKDILTVVSPIEDTPAFEAGIKAGDQILKIDGKSTKDITIMEAVNKLRGPKDTKVTVTIMRENLPNPKDFIITRSIIKIRSIKSKIYEKNIGYIRIVSFQERTMDDLKKALRDLEEKAKPLKGIVLDMRNNPGGLYSQSVEVSDAFLKEGTIVSTKGRIKNMDRTDTAKNDGDEIACPIVVLVNEGTASAAEIVSGALQDNGRALVVGVHTFGKASVQTVIPLEDGAALKLTTAKYYTPSGRSIQAEGIIPDIVVKFVKPAELTAEAEDRLREEDLKGHIKPAKEENRRAEEVLKKEQDDLMQDNQLKSAIDILKSWDIFKKTIKN
ncbi:MAG: S41 family peptidase [Deltaproteobacteria bacterium]|nr:S41 family peptidase [Deltaproteobacteria bacterium]